MKRIGKYDEAVKSFVDEYWKQKFRSPTLREIMVAVGINSSSHVYYILRKLFYVEDVVARGIVPNWVKNAIQKAENNSVKEQI